MGVLAGPLSQVLGVLLVVGFPLLFWVGVWQAVVHGPFEHRFWKGETVFGFTSAIFAICFGAGFFGPMILAPDANQGPMLGLFITGPAGLILGLIWGLMRRKARESARARRR